MESRGLRANSVQSDDRPAAHGRQEGLIQQGSGNLESRRSWIRVVDFGTILRIRRYSSRLDRPSCEVWRREGKGTHIRLNRNIVTCADNYLIGMYLKF